MDANRDNDTAAVNSAMDDSVLQAHLHGQEHIGDNGWKSLKSWFYFTTLVIFVLWIISLFILWQYSIASLLFLIPLLIIIYWWHKNGRSCSLNHLLRQYFYGFISIAIMAFFLQMVAIVVITLIFAAFGIFQSTSYSFGWFLYIIICVIAYVYIEEIFKLSFSINSRNEINNDNQRIDKTHTITSTATSLGYATSTGLLWLLIPTMLYYSYGGKNVPVGWLMLDAFIIGVIGIPMHLMTGYLIGLYITQYNYGIRDSDNGNNNNNNEDNNNNGGGNDGDQAQQPQLQQRIQQQRQSAVMSTNDHLGFLWVPCIARGTYVFMLVLGLLVLPFSAVGAILIILSINLEYICLVLVIKKEEKKLPFDYLSRAGQLNIFGYGTLSDEPSEDAQPRNDEDIQLQVGNQDENQPMNATEPTEK